MSLNISRYCDAQLSLAEQLHLSVLLEGESKKSESWSQQTEAQQYCHTERSLDLERAYLRSPIGYSSAVEEH